jgi:predicted nuclease of predicted toxin-antitoxin system
LRDHFLIDECLSGGLVAVAKARGFEADYVPHIGKGGWHDWNLVPFAVDNDYIVVTLQPAGLSEAIRQPEDPSWPADPDCARARKQANSPNLSI